MKILRLIPLGLVAYALAQAGFVYQDSSRDLTMRAKSGLLNQLPNKTSTFLLKGGVTADSKKKGISLSANQVQGDTVSDGKESKIHHAIATGDVHLVKTTNTGGSTLTSSRADYTDRGADVFVVMTGGVRITNSNSAKRSNTVITGPHGEATLDPTTNAKAKSGLRTATVDGGVRVQIQQSTGGQIVATGRQLVLDNLAHIVTLSGGVQVHGTDKSGFGNLQSAERAILKLNEKGDVIGTEVRS